MEYGTYNPYIPVVALNLLALGCFVVALVAISVRVAARVWFAEKKRFIDNLPLPPPDQGDYP